MTNEEYLKFMYSPENIGNCKECIGGEGYKGFEWNGGNE